MKPRVVALLCAVSCMAFITGCWDREELSDRVFDLAAAADLQQDGTILTSAQFFIPSRANTTGGTSGEKPFFIESGGGHSYFESIQMMRQKLSRIVTRGHRRNFYIGEDLAKKGVYDMMDAFTRDPGNRIRMDIWVVKGNTGLDVLQVPYPLEKIPSVASVKIHRAVGGSIGTSYLGFLLASNEEGSCPTLPAVDIVQGASPQRTIRFYGRALFNHDYKLVGYLNFIEASYRLWMLNGLKYLDLAERFPDQGGGIVGVHVTQFGSKLTSSISGTNKVKMEIELTGGGHVGENETKLDLSKQEHLQIVQDRFNAKTSEHVLEMIKKVQKQYGTDVLGFSTVLNRQHPMRGNK
ncbi:spore germination protein KC [Paenibacillus sp. OV219]|nr:Ger(x)C family spore germination protein [Paenibacillus sp. OV219]SEN14920.1 spore germination protein KC [Paenibacillus sp. OV219]